MDEHPIQDPWFTVQKLDTDTYAISEYGHWEKVHSFLLLGDRRAALIDTGLGIDSMKRITDQLTDLPIIVLTTHVHWDHIGSHSEYDHICVHEADADWLRHGIKGLPMERIRKDVARDITKPVPGTFDPFTYRPYQGESTQLLRDGDKVDLGGRMLTIYHTPGHSPGHICVHDPKKGYLFTGDLLYTGTPVYAFYPSTNPAHLVNSLERIAYIAPVTQVIGSHNQLGLDPAILEEVKRAVHHLRENDLAKYGTGTHTFHGFSLRF